MLFKKFLKKEVTVLHYILLSMSKIFIGLGIGIYIADYAAPFSLPLILIGGLVLLPTLNYLLTVEEKEEVKFEKKLK